MLEGEEDINGTSTHRQLGPLSQPISNAIQCIKPFDAINFEVDKTNFPIYIKDSKWNTNANFDYGAFVKLETKLTSSALEIDTFGFTFAKAGTYVFANYAAPTQFQTIVLVTDKEDGCHGSPTWPITVENMQKLGITGQPLKMKSFDVWLHALPVFFVLCCFLMIYIQRVCEIKIEKREHELRMQREGHNMNLQKYFKKSQDKFDKLEYLADLYKLIRENLEEINGQIAENDRRTEEENRDNMNKMLQDKHSLLRELRRGKGDTNLEDIRSGLLQMLSNLRF
jgi:hypothetical protein